jgi:hypothetical protein
MAQSDELDNLLLPAAVRTDALRAAGLQGLQGVTEAQQSALEREQGRLAQKLGPDHPRVKAVAQRLEDGHARVRDLAVEVSRAETVAPKAGEDEWALHGHLRWPDLAPAPELTVSLLDAQGQWLRTLGYACTGPRGYFSLVAKVQRSPAGGPSSSLSAYPRVTDSSGKELYRGKDALAVTPGATDYREIILDGEAASCGPPDQDVPIPESPAAPANPAPGRPRKTRRPA